MALRFPKPTRPLVIINGLGAPRAASQVYGLFFRARGYRVYVVPQAFLNFGDIRASGRRTGEVVARALSRTGAERTPLIGISLGGLIGHWYVHCGGGASRISTFVSVGGPLSGSATARIGAVPPLRFVPSLQQAAPDSDVLEDVRRAPHPADVRLVSLGTRGDVMTPESARAADGYELVNTPHGRFPVGHWYLYLHPQNLRRVYEILQQG